MLRRLSRWGSDTDAAGFASGAPGDPSDEVATAFARAAIGGELPHAIGALIERAGQLRSQPELALPLLLAARAAAPNHPAPIIALYRFHFYGHRWALARESGEDALAIARSALGPSFGDCPPQRESIRGDAAVRFYLFALKGLAYLNLRLEDNLRARRLLRELRRLDPEDWMGAALLLHVLAHREQTLRDEAGLPDASGFRYVLPPGGYPARGWDGTPP